MLSSEDRFNIIKQSIAGQIEGPAYEAIQAAEQESLQANTEEAPQSEQQTQIPQTPVGPPPAQTIPRVYDQLGSLIDPGSTGVGLNQMAGTSPGQTIQPGEYETGGFKDWWKKLSNKKGREWMKEINPKDSSNDYDYEMFFNKRPDLANAMLNDDPHAHFNDIGKRQHHPTFSTESAYSTKDTPGGEWTKDKDENWSFEHSEYTLKNSDKTEAYLERERKFTGSNEYQTLYGSQLGRTIDLIEKRKTGGIKSKKKSTTSKDDTSIRDYGMLPEVTVTDKDPVRPWMLLKKLRRNWAKNLNPFDYGKNPLKTAFETGVLNKKDKRDSVKMDINKVANQEKLEDPRSELLRGDKEEASMWAKEREDLFKKLMGHSPEHNSLIKNDDGSFSSPYAEHIIKKRMGNLLDPDYDYPADEKEKILKHVEKYGSYAGKVLGNHQMKFGTDKKGDYVDYKDIWDLNPLDPKVKTVAPKWRGTVDKVVTGFNKHVLGMTPPVVKGRVYYENGGPKSKAPKPLTESDAKLEEEWPEMLKKQRFVESGFNTSAKSEAGATGSAQIMPDTLDYAKMKGWVPETIGMKDLTGAEGYSISKHIQEKYMDNLFNRSWNKGTNEAKKAKALLAYNWGPENTRVKLNKLIDQGVNVWDNTDFTKYFNEESRQYKGKILDDLTTKKDPYVQRDYKKLKDLSPLLRMHGGPKVLYNNKKLKK